MSFTNALSIDVEDYFQVSAFEHAIDRCQWDKMELRVPRNINKTLQVFSDHNVKATFFTLGWIADRCPEVIKSIVSEGHELASHGYAHERVTSLTQAQFKEDVYRTKILLEDITGQRIRGYRAPSYSINSSNTWALETLAETGHEYSSSIYPGNHDHYGFPGAPRFTFRDKKTGLVEIPITTVKLYHRLFPAAGGGFFRFYPYALSRWAINRVNAVDRQSSVFYLHPWELDPDQPRQHNISMKTRFRHYLNLEKTENRLGRLLKDFNWGRMDEVFINGAEIPVYELS